MQAKAGATAVPYPGHLDAHRTNAGVYLALRQGAMPDHRVAALGISSVSIPCSKHRDFCLNGLGQEPLGSLTYDLGEGVLGEELWRWKRNRGMFVHGVSTPASYGG